MSSHQRQPPPGAVTILEDGEITIAGRLPWSSNFTFLVDLTLGEQHARAVYKPLEGEQDLWDFPPNIYKREVAAYELSVALGWPNIPPTIIREDAPYGIGSLQLFVPADFEQHYFTLAETSGHEDEFLRIAVFDIIANNTDRKSGHCLLGDDGTIYAIDNGLCFHEEPKLRTVIWQFENMAIPEKLLAGIKRVAQALPEPLIELIDKGEQHALVERVQELLGNPTFPRLTSQRQFPWPLI